MVLEGDASFGGTVIADRVSLSTAGLSGTSALNQNDEFDGLFLLPLSAESIEFIETHRGDGDITISLELRVRWQEMTTAEAGQTVAGAVHWDQTSQSVRLPRSDWLQLLGQMDWTDVSLFEVPVLPLSENADLKEALNLLRAAQVALRAPDYKGVLAKCRAALESAAKYHAQGDKTKQGFEVLLARAYPQESAKASALDEMISGVSTYLHTLGRHEQYPAIQPSRSEAELAYATTVAVFSLLSRRLTGVETI